MAYDFIPTTSKEIEKKTQIGTARPEFVKLFNYITKTYKVEEPLAIDPSNKKEVKLTRKLAGEIDLVKLKKTLGLSCKVVFGDGSRGGRGTKNLGNIFETKLYNDIVKWVDGEKILDNANKKLIHELAEEYNLNSKKNIKIIPMGHLDQKRPLKFIGGKIYVGSTDFDIGKTITDISLDADGDHIHLSLKYGGTVTFFNAGVGKTLMKTEMEKGAVTNKDGLAILNMFNINNEKFCEIFNSYGDKTKMEKFSEDTFNHIDKDALQDLIKSGVGYGYHLIHKVSSGIHHYKMSKKNLDKYTEPLSCKVYYGGLKPGPIAKRVDMVVETPMFILKFNIRNKNAGIYPTHFMADYSMKE